ncbi:glycosyltransferase family 1 protein [soil metagenome]
MAVEPPARVALVGHRLSAATATGIGRYYREIAQGLVAVADPARHRYLVAATREPAPPDWLPPGLAHRRIGGNRKLTVLRWALTGGPPLDGDLGRPDLVHALHSWAPTPCRAPLITTIHDVMPLQHPAWFGRAERWLFRRAVDHARDHAVVIVTESHHAAGVITAETGIEPARIRVVSGGVGDEFRRRSTPDGLAALTSRYGVVPGRYVIALGAVSARKNLPMLLQALARVEPARLGDPGLLVVGPEGAEAAEVHTAVERLGLQARVRFTGYVPREDLPGLVGAAAALVHPSRDEGFGLTPLEAMAAGTAVVASTAGSLREVVADAGVLVDPDDVDGWAEAITRVVGDPEMQASLVAAGDRRQDHFRWARAATETLAVHDEVLGRGR